MIFVVGLESDSVLVRADHVNDPAAQVKRFAERGEPHFERVGIGQGLVALDKTSAETQLLIAARMLRLIRASKLTSTRTNLRLS